MLIRSAELEGCACRDVRLEAGGVAEIGSGLARRTGEPVVEAAGGALLPGLHDHHIHLLALAAAASSVRCGPEAVADAAGLARALAAAPCRGDWVRGVGYHESVAGDLDRDRLDALEPRRPVRIQHRSGALWMLNSAGLTALGLDDAHDATSTPPGVERDASGRATGRLFRLDGWLRERLGRTAAPDLTDVGQRLARYGVTGVSDATVGNDAAALEVLTTARRAGSLPQRLWIMGRCELPEPQHPGVARGPVKLVLDDAALPDPDALSAQIAAAHAGGRGVAIHCVTRAELVLAISALETAGPHPGDRIEHAGVAPPELVERIRLRAGLAVVTQPHFLWERGDAYAVDVDPRDRAWLYRGRAWLEAGVPLAGGSDAPFGDADPWTAMRAAVERRSRGGHRFDAGEALTPEEARDLFSSSPATPGGPRRRIAPGQAADLCLLDRPWREARSALSSQLVAATWIDGELVWERGGGAAA